MLLQIAFALFHGNFQNNLPILNIHFSLTSIVVIFCVTYKKQSEKDIRLNILTLLQKILLLHFKKGEDAQGYCRITNIVLQREYRKINNPNFLF